VRVHDLHAGDKPSRPLAIGRNGVKSRLERNGDELTANEIPRWDKHREKPLAKGITQDLAALQELRQDELGGPVPVEFPFSMRKAML
jgi:hypothetical protein